MKTINKKRSLYARSKALISGAFLTVMILSFTSCTPKITFLTSSIVPAAEGVVTVKDDNNNNYSIKLDITNLAAVDRLTPPKNTYVVWMETDRGAARNIGRIVVTNKMNVSFETVSSFRPTKIFITAEDNENAQYPGEMLVLTTNSFWN
ncbi:MAG TPA: hypothetical protein VLQ76_02640 [Bacteroidales bacterium]|nr:hypothetical protein [Bacteroidales bacterium]